MSTIFVCPRCDSISKIKSRCYSGTSCDRDHGEERIEYAPVAQAVPFSIGDHVLWDNKNGANIHTVECLDVATQQARQYSNAAKVIEIVEGVVVSALTEDPSIQMAFSLRQDQWCSGSTVLVKAPHVRQQTMPKSVQIFTGLIAALSVFTALIAVTITMYLYCIVGK